MLPFRQILLPIDYSEPCLAVVPYAQDMLHHFDAELTLVHAYGPLAAAVLRGSQEDLIDPNFPERVRCSEQERLQLFAQHMFRGRRVGLVAELGEPGCVVHKVAESERADLIMMATHGHGPVRRFLLGSVTAKVLHDASTVVWTGIGAGLTGHFPAIPYRSILCALGDTSEAEAVLKAAASLAGAYGAQLSLLHAVQTPVVGRADFNSYKKELIDEAYNRLRELKQKLNIDAPVSVVDAPVAEGVREMALRRKADLVVTGRGHCQDTMSRMWSHLYSIVRESPCPVLSV